MLRKYIYKNCTTRLHLYHIKILKLTFVEYNNKFGIDNKAMSVIKIEEIGRDISLIPIEIVMRDQTPDIIRETASKIRNSASQICELNFNTIVNLHPTDG